jgi:hypothetical protein
MNWSYVWELVKRGVRLKKMYVTERLQDISSQSTPMNAYYRCQIETLPKEESQLSRYPL